MNETKHTPGPWETAPVHRQGIASVSVRLPGGKKIAAVWLKFHGHRLTQDSYLEGCANACLIAAAPDLLDMLKKARECIAYCRRAHKDAQSGEGVPIEAFIDAVIAKAEGRTASPSNPR